MKRIPHLLIFNLLSCICIFSGQNRNAEMLISKVNRKTPAYMVSEAGEYKAYRDSIHSVHKIKDIVIYEDPRFYSSFPSVIKRPDGELLVAFRRAPDRKVFGEKFTSHVDPNSYLMMVRSNDGETWTKEPDLIYANPFGGSQDPCLLQLRDGMLLCTSYGWAFVRPDGIPDLKKPYAETDGAIFLGGYLLRSADGGKTWQKPIYPPRITTELYLNAFGEPLPAYNRGALYEGKSGSIFWVVAASDSNSAEKTSTHLLISGDKGLTWNYSSPVATDAKVGFNETSVYETPKGAIIAFLRTANFDDQACIARSTDGGKSFGKWESMGFQGHPLNALRLSDDRVLLTYGYRHKPFGIRARILNAECTDFATAPEIILREDGGNGDIGYTWPVLLDRNRVLVTYYFNKNNGTRYIAGTIFEIK
jgi:sialidase-1